MNRLAPVDIVNLWRKYTSKIPPRFALGSAWHESRYNADSVSVADQGDGSDSIGLYQLAQSEAAIRAFSPLANLKDPAENTRVYATIAEQNLALVITAQNAWAAANPDNPGVGFLDPAGPFPDDVWAYVAIAHNQGDRAVTTTIAKFGLSWARYYEGNLDVPGVKDHLQYYMDAMSGGPDWNYDWDKLPPDPSASTGFWPRALLVLVLVFVTLHFLVRGGLHAAA